MNTVVRYVAMLSVAVVLWVAAGGQALAQTVVRVDTSVGSFSLELFDDVAPVTVRNFVNYVITGRYDGTFIHRSEPGFVIQGGWLSAVPAEGGLQLREVQTGPQIINEFSIPNTRGTIAMAKQGGNPSSATSQWFINLSENTSLDTNNGGFTVFGRVVGSGMDVVDEIVNLDRRTFSGFAFLFPVVNYDGVNFTPDNLVTLTMSVTTGDYELVNRLEPSSDTIRIKVAGGSAGSAEATLRILSTNPEIIVELVPGSIVPLNAVETGFSLFDPASGQLLIPELDVGGQVAFRNLLFNLTDPANLRFTLQSYEE